MFIKNSSLVILFLAAFLLSCLDRRNSEELRPSTSEQEQPSVQNGDSSGLSLIAFDTGILKGHFRFGHGGKPGRSDFPGVGQCVFAPLNVSLVNATHPNALLMPE